MKHILVGCNFSYLDNSMNLVDYIGKKFSLMWYKSFASFLDFYVCSYRSSYFPNINSCKYKKESMNQCKETKQEMKQRDLEQQLLLLQRRESNRKYGSNKEKFNIATAILVAF